MVMIMTKQEKIERFRKMNETIEKGQIVCAGSSLMEMFPVEKFVQEDKLDLVIYNRGIGGFVTQELLDNIDVKQHIAHRCLHIGSGAKEAFHQYWNQ